jgi:hypothetical protein
MRTEPVCPRRRKAVNFCSEEAIDMSEELTPAPPAAAGTTRALISVPGLRNAAPIGGGCCAKAADDAVREELDSWPALKVVAVELDSETVSVSVEADKADQLIDAIEALRDLGLNTAEVVSTP